jgi:hypothetical protein
MSEEEKDRRILILGLVSIFLSPLLLALHLWRKYSALKSLTTGQKLLATTILETSCKQ